MLVHKNIHFERLLGTRVVAQPDALNAVHTGSVALRFAADELFVSPALNAEQTGQILAQDAHAIIIAEGAFSGAWVDEPAALALLERLAEWEVPSERPALVQGAVAGLATKVWFEQDRVLFVVQTPYAHELEDRLS